MRPEDVGPAYLSWVGDPHTMRFVGPELTSLSAEQHRAIVASTDNRTRFLLFIEALSEDPVGFLRVRLEPKHRRALSTVVIGDPGQRRAGAMMEAHRAVRAFLFDHASIDKLCFSVYGEHDLMLRMLEKQSYIQKEGVLRRHERLPGIGWQDVHLFAIFRDGSDEE